MHDFVEQGAVVDEGAPQVLGAGLSGGVTVRDVVRDAVVADQLRVADGKVVGPLLEVGYGVAARLHRLAEQGVGVADRAAGIVDELSLDGAPVVGEAGGFGGAQRPQLEGVHALLAPPKLSLGLALVAGLIDRRAILRAVAVAKPLRAALLSVQDGPNDDHNRDRCEDDSEGVVHGSLRGADAARGCGRDLERVASGRVPREPSDCEVLRGGPIARGSPPRCGRRGARPLEPTAAGPARWRRRRGRRRCRSGAGSCWACRPGRWRSACRPAEARRWPPWWPRPWPARRAPSPRSSS